MHRRSSYLPLLSWNEGGASQAMRRGETAGLRRYHGTRVVSGVEGGGVGEGICEVH